jgi:hypothetical protein
MLNISKRVAKRVKLSSNYSSPTNYTRLFMETHKRINVEQIETSKNSNEIKNNPIQ